MIIKARPLVLLLTIGCAASAGCAVTTAPGDDMSQAGTGGGSPGVVSGTGGTTGVPGATGGTTGVPGATGGTTGVPGATGGTTGVPGATGGAGGVVTPGAYPGTAAPSAMSTMGAIVSGVWQGYAYTWKGMVGMAVVNPAAGAEFADNNLCAWGSLSASYDSVFGLGFSVAQAPGETTPGTWDISGSTGITYAVTNDGGTPLRIQVNVGGVDYCSDITASGTLLWGDFNSTCWAPATGTVLAGTGLMESVSVVAIGDMAMARSPAFCISSIAPI